jgi:hypothetical protein
VKTVDLLTGVTVAAFLALTPIAFELRRRVRAFQTLGHVGFASIIGGWALLALVGFIAYVLQNDTIALLLALFSGWLYSTIYFFIWWGLFALAGALRGKRT